MLLIIENKNLLPQKFNHLIYQTSFSYFAQCSALLKTHFFFFVHYKLVQVYLLLFIILHNNNKT